MQERTYDQLYAVIESLAGVDSFTANEQSDILNFVNRRAYAAYHATSVWTRFIVVGEDRTIEEGRIIEYNDADLDRPDIGEFIRIHKTEPFLDRSAVEYDFYVDGQGAHILNIASTEDSLAYVTYKKEFSDYTEDSIDIPFEWFEYLAHASYADFLRMDGQLEKAFAEEARAKEYLDFSLEKAESRMNNSTIGKRFSTHANQQRR